MKAKLFLVLFVLQFLFFLKVGACTTFVLKDSSQIVFGRNFDFNVGSGFVVNNPKGISKYALVSNEDNVMRWTSKFGSVTFNQFGREFPYEGMNEKGLVVALMILSKTKYPEIDNRKATSPLQWIQYQLDVASTVDEVIASDSFLRISKELPIGIHFLVCDASGKAATIEFVEGKMIYHVDKQLPIPLLTNNTYDESISYLRQFDIMGGEKPVQWNNFYDIDWKQDVTLSVNQLFAVAAKKLNKPNSSLNLVGKAFDALQAVTVNDHTQWSVVFDISNKKIYFKNAKREETINLNFTDFDFESNGKVEILDIQSATSVNTMSQLKLYTPEINREYIFNAFKPLTDSGFFPVQIPDAVIEAYTQFPGTLTYSDYYPSSK